MVLVFCVLLTLQTVKGEIQWDVYKKITEYGEELLLSCKVPDCCTKSAGWNSEDKTIFLNIANLMYNESAKYDARYGNGRFFLFIRDFSIEDVDISYSCSYGFATSRSKILNTSMVFEDFVDKKEPYLNKENDCYPVYIPGLVIGFLHPRFNIRGYWQVLWVIFGRIFASVQHEFISAQNLLIKLYGIWG